MLDSISKLKYLSDGIMSDVSSAYKCIVENGDSVTKENASHKKIVRECIKAAINAEKRWKSMPDEFDVLNSIGLLKYMIEAKRKSDMLSRENKYWHDYFTAREVIIALYNGIKNDVQPILEKLQ